MKGSQQHVSTAKGFCHAPGLYPGHLSHFVQVTGHMGRLD